MTLDKKYCKDCLLKDGEFSEITESFLQDGGEWYECSVCKGLEWVGSEQLLVILWAAMGHTPKQRELLQEYTKLVLEK